MVKFSAVGIPPPSNYMSNPLLVENFLSLPFVVLRRQCQVNAVAIRCHRTPFTLAPIVYNLQLNQGVHCLWKGVSSSIVTRGLDILLDTVLADLLGLPRFLGVNSRGKAAFIATFLFSGRSVVLQLMLFTSLFAVRGKPGIFDCLSEGLSRLSADLLGQCDSRRFNVCYLALPSVLHRLSNYLMFNEALFSHAMLRRYRSKFDKFFPEVFTAFTSNLLAEAILYPVGTVVYRLYLQGSRVIIDNMDNGTSVVPINTCYQGVIDCVRTIYDQEGVKGFYKGFGALVLQYMIHLALVHGLRKIFLHLERNKSSNSVEESTRDVFSAFSDARSLQSSSHHFFDRPAVLK
ncbi:Solute carrier family 25 member 46 [Trichuris trichiura]|uniref:Solute carrier family 25 member 46 n=1 Tax=Trichuris trichiura TaxID=36087 RepID=A0A077Z205_TRITR|nr:Solute carrier family 25 member 46 [Trichuris trichiura]